MPQAIKGPDGNVYQFPDGTSKDAAVSYFKSKGIGVNTASPITSAITLPEDIGGGTQHLVPPPPPVSAQQRQEAKDSLSNQYKYELKGQASMVGRIAPAVGSAVAGVPGATIGGLVAGASRLGIEHSDNPVRSVLTEGAEQGALEIVGGKLIPAALSKASKSLSIGADRAMNKILGLSKSLIPKWERGDPAAIREVGRVVNKEVGGAASMARLAEKISQTKAALVSKVEAAASHPQGKLTNAHAVIANQALKDYQYLLDKGLKEQADSVLKTADTLIKNHPPMSNPKQLLEMKRALMDHQEWERIGLQGSSGFRKRLYSELNKHIAQSLPKEAAAEFVKQNRNVNRLIIAEQSLSAKMAGRELGSSSVTQEALKRAAPSLAGAGVGGAYGYHHGGATGAIKGAVAGAVIGKLTESTGVRSAGIAARKAASSVAKSGGRINYAQALRAAQAAEDAKSSNAAQ